MGKIRSSGSLLGEKVKGWVFPIFPVVPTLYEKKNTYNVIYINTGCLVTTVTKQSLSNI